ncbi:hypothetical protein HYC85_025141 [Camellia sinensis]|uniref:Protein HIRA n=1 Tax=Camellia sinensis TaxID=4442 RepID=A0A7J7GBG0_CAMSI|nr:hypothetical protein HYC85_025141 [Camellia sinensis]
MIAEKPSWVGHEGMQIFSIDIQPGGLRFATGGGDHKVRIWNMKSVGRDLETNESTSKLLATLRDHFGSVNCVRWAKHSRYVASGSDDQAILIHERKPGSGTTEFGSGEPPDIENWKVAMTLRGHTADVVDLNWSPDDSTLASGSLDNTVHIWNISSGICIAVLRGHSSLVKGVTWDPIGSFIASQSDDKTVIIWRTSDWSLAHRTDGHWTKSLGSTFFRRLGWSPCGHFVTTTHGFQKPRHSAPVLERGEWSATFDFLGHNAPVIVVKFNHSMFTRSLSNAQEVKAAPVGWTNGTSKTEENEPLPYNVIAIGSQDRTITVWTTASPRPLFVAKHFFTQSVVDLSWSPDGYSLLSCSLDGTVATFHFEEKELGQRLTDAELEELKRSRYGDVGGRQANLAESPAQLLLEAASAKQTKSKKVTPNVSQNQTTILSSAHLEVSVKASESQVDDGKKSSGASVDALNKAATTARMSSPVKQREYRRPDGRKRIIPEAVGVPVQLENISGDLQPQVLDFPLNSSDHRKEDNGMVGIREGCIRRTIGMEASVLNRQGIVMACGSSAASSTLSIRIFDKTEGDDTVPVCLEARPREHAATDIVGVGNTFAMKETEIACTRGAQTLWSDRISGKITVLAGNANFWAVGCEDGCLQVSTIKIISAKLSKSGFPLVVLATRHAFLFDMNLMCWLRVADDCFPASNFASSWNLGSIQNGELSPLQVDVGKFLARKPGWSRVTDDGVQTRAHLETQLASTLALKSPSEYRQCLLSYIRFLAREADDSRLREVCESFLGPPTGMAEAASVDPKNPVWDPCVLGRVEKKDSCSRPYLMRLKAWFDLGMMKHRLLREDILPAMASNRKVQRLLNEFTDLLSEYEIPEMNPDQNNSAPPTSSLPATDNMDNNPAPSATDQIASTLPPPADQMVSFLLPTEKNECAPTSTDQMDSVAPATNEMPTENEVNLDPLASDQVPPAQHKKASASELGFFFQ